MDDEVETPALVGAERATRQAREIWRSLRAADDFISARALHQRIGTEGGAVSLGTVYKRLGRLVEIGAVDSVTSTAGEVLYRVRTDRSAHRLICRHCGHSVAVYDAGMDRWSREKAAEFGFHRAVGGLKLFGTCGDCGSAPCGRPVGEG